MASLRVRALAGFTGRMLLRLAFTVLIAGVVLVVLAYYTALEFDVEAVALALVLAGILVAVWTRWR